MKKIALFLALLFFAIISNAEKKALTIHDTIRLPNSDKELELYKMLYQNEKEANALNYTVLFTIVAIVVGFIIFILGSQAFFNYRLKKQDLVNLESKLKLHFLSELDKTNSEIHGLELRSNRELSEAKTYLISRIEKLGEATDMRINILKSSVHSLMADSFKSQGHDQAALINFVSSCTYELKSELELSLELSLEKLKTFLETLTEVSDYSFKNIEQLIIDTRKKYPSKYDVLLNDIEKEYNSKTVIPLN